MAKRSNSSRRNTQTSSRRGYSDEDIRRSFREDDFYAGSTSGNSKEKIFTSIYEDIDSDEWQSSHRSNDRTNGRSRTGQSGRASRRGRSNRRESQPSRGRRSGALIQKKERKPFGSSFVLPKKEESDFTIIACVVLLSFIGLVMVTSSSYYYAYTTLGDSMHFFRRQLIWLVLGSVVMVVAMKLPWILRWLKRFAWPIYLVSVVCNILVFFIGIEVNGSTRWLGVGQLSFQPAELSKFAVALLMSVLVEEHQEDITDKRVFWTLLGIIAVPTVLVVIENLSSAVIIAAIGVIIMFIGGAKIKDFLLPVVIVGSAAFVFLVLPMMIPLEAFPKFIRGAVESVLYRTDRIQAWLDPFAFAQDEGYQTVQSLYAVASGGFFGRGLGQSIQKLGFIPEAHNDIIFSIICEELGMFGAIIVIVLFGMFTWHGIKISLSAPNKFTALLSAGIVGQIALQAILNIAVNTNTIPPTGVSLPFISYGGSSLLFLMASVGILLNISSYTRKTSAS